MLPQDVQGSLDELWGLIRCHHDTLFAWVPLSSSAGGRGARAAADVPARLVGKRIQVTWSRRPTAPQCTILTYNQGGAEASGSSHKTYGHLPLSRTTLIVWVYLYDPDEPDKPLPSPSQAESTLITTFFPRAGGQPAQSSAPSSGKASGSSSGAPSSSAAIDLTGGDDGEETEDEDPELQSVLARSWRER